MQTAPISPAPFHFFTCLADGRPDAARSLPTRRRDAPVFTTSRRRFFFSLPQRVYWKRCIAPRRYSWAKYTKFCAKNFFEFLKTCYCLTLGVNCFLRLFWCLREFFIRNVRIFLRVRIFLCLILRVKKFWLMVEKKCKRVIFRGEESPAFIFFSIISKQKWLKTC